MIISMLVCRLHGAENVGANEPITAFDEGLNFNNSCILNVKVLQEL